MDVYEIDVCRTWGKKKKKDPVRRTKEDDQEPHLDIPRRVERPHQRGRKIQLIGALKCFVHTWR